jgi:ketosteroid isomerase-like protein
MEHAPVVDLYHAYVDAWKRDDREAAMEFWDDDIVMVAPGNNPHSGVYRGKQAVVHSLIDRIYAETSSAHVLGLDDLAFGVLHVFAIAHERFEKADGRVLETRRLLVYRWHSGKIVEVKYYDDDQEAADRFWAE